VLTRNRTSGFSLIELMVAVAVLSIILLGFGAAISASSTQRMMADERRVAEQTLSTYVELLRGKSMADILLEPTTFEYPAPIPGLRGTVTRTLTTYPDESGPGSGDPDHDALGFPLDLNADGDTDDGVVAAAGLFMLPAKLTITYSSANMSHDLKTGAIQNTMEVRLYVYFSSF
jgi:prepilin-type N-terminal cleavage/methylation domain-containing protein